MKRVLYIAAFMLVFAAPVIAGQQSEITIPYIKEAPPIDGWPDDDAVWTSFACTDGPAIGDSTELPQYITGWNPGFLYLIIRFRADSLTVRDRAYQNGDGFHLVVASAQNPGDTSGEFYVMRFSPGDKARNLPPKKGIWYYNKDLSGQSLGARTKFSTASRDGFQYFELLLPWSEIPPYHPWSERRIGMNLCLVRAGRNNGKTNYFWLHDRLMQSENSPRKFIHARFGFPESLPGVMSHAEAVMAHIRKGDSLAVRVVSAAGTACSQTYQFRIKSADRYTYYTTYQEQHLQPGLNRFTVAVPAGRLQTGGYLLHWKDAAGNEGEIPFTVLPFADNHYESERLQSLQSTASPGTLTTLQFMLQTLEHATLRLYPYETAGEVREQWNSYHALVEALEAGHDSLSGRNGIVRRAFRSPFDHTLQPYSVKIPAGFDAGKRYPVVVMLHGSGSDDRDIIGSNLPGTEECIVVAPFGRGTSNCFTTGHASEDIMEVLADLKANYPVDTTRIIIAGFSMGGYGAMRVFWQYPESFRGVAVISGHPALGPKWIGEGHPDFLRQEFLAPFRDVPVFIYHSRNDLNCPYPLIEQMEDCLRRTGAVVSISVSQSGGHGLMDEGAAPLFREWVGETLGM